MSNVNWKIIPPDKKSLNEAYEHAYFHSSLEKECVYCHTKFKYGRKNQISCGLCELEVNGCLHCGEIYRIKLSYNTSGISGTSMGEVLECVKNRLPIYRFCGIKCLANHNSDQWRKSEKFQEFILSDEFHTLESKKLAGERLKKYVNSEEGKRHTEFHNQLLNKRVLKFCEKCGKMTFHDGYDHCCECNGTHLLYPTMIEIDDCVQYHVGNGDYVLWEQFKQGFKIKNIKVPEGFIVVPTFRSQNYDDWTGARVAFEQNLVDIGVSWFVYIKFYVDRNGEMKPLVVGKSGSMAVNSSGTDVNFSVDVEDGAARRFLSEENLEWCKTQIAILRCESEQDALDEEKRIQNEYGLFGS